ncbi:DUF6602 domain-containing protein [Pedobacter gandavensis]|uniref:DUF6602 domain-containing protein n=1 Tax=Pedobacter gandavensis TaxID=2679963 RepID=UPI00292F9288|nr:DUF6602 domain-containing protein [Pedobacter gandavensis]
MPSTIFTKILDDSINRFIGEYGTMPRQLFYNEEKNLFHPGEYGKYREEIIRKLFRNIVYEDLEVAEGFLINIKDQHSTQCDVIIYDYKKTPVLKENNKLFVPVETSVGVGEVKSTLSKKEFKTALRKLANNKKLKEFANGSIVKRNKIGDFEPLKNHSDQLFSFLICQKLDFKIDDIDFNDVYENIDYRNRHNLILSIEDGLFDYSFSFELMKDEQRKVYEEAGVNTSKDSNVEYPNFLQVECNHNWIKIEKNNPIQHVREFLSSIHFGIHNSTILNVDIRQYYRELNNDLFFKGNVK